MRGGCMPFGGMLMMLGGGAANPPGGAMTPGGKPAFGGTIMVPSLVIGIPPSHGHGIARVRDVRWKLLNQPVLWWHSLSRKVPQPDVKSTPPANVRNAKRGIAKRGIAKRGI